MANPKRRPGFSQRSGPVAAPSIPLDARSRSNASISSSIQGRSAPPPTTGSLAQPISLTKRLLFSHLPPNAPIPPIFQYPGLPPALNTELYDFLALALRAFINPWWTKITRYDKEFLVQVTSIVTVVFRNLESRSLAADLSPLVFRDLPSILTQHWVDYRTAKQKLNTSYSLAGSSSFHALFHAQQQHIGVSADGQFDEVYVRTAIDAVLKACLPPEDWEAEPERYIVREIVVKIVSKDVAGRLTQPWFIHKIILDLLGPPPAKFVEPPDPHQPHPGSSTSFHLPSFHTIIVFFLSAIQTISSIALTLIHSYKRAVHGIQMVNQHHNFRHQGSKPSSVPSPSTVPSPVDRTPSTVKIDEKATPVTQTQSFISDHSPLLHGVENPVIHAIDLTDNGLSTSRPPVPPVQPPPPPPPPSPPPPPHYPLPAALTRLRPAPTDLGRAPVALFVELLTLRRRYAGSAMASLLEMLQAGFTRFLDRLLPYVLYEHVLSPERLTSIIIVAKRTLFPNGYPAAAPPDPTQEEQVAMKEAVVERTVGIVPPFVSSVLLGATPNEQKRTIEEMIDPLSDQACNAHLLICILDAFLLALLPELGGEEEVSAVNTSARSSSPSDGSGGGKSGNGDGIGSSAGFGLGVGEVRSMEGGSEGEDGRSASTRGGGESGTGAGGGRRGSGLESMFSV
ncbi:uncharacterized protein STEHIDRAFT_101584 [Stereum hirsutum FP-91666 SS1]|uniref:uncharacterized protein n=1 Tax=Stereum hirsutum (strain FP-91666) TaxID=721885 RepID=UPI00044492EE|nr:uncharacterized protein STEHIDRAFT_101584 [Stereum hirsutum FP-91666 SS1]EIM83390.1 hypothetical protein STEHIDRAFT_101584 [Stereum hirsutum FP-91666 SS1]